MQHGVPCGPLFGVLVLTGFSLSLADDYCRWMERRSKHRSGIQQDKRGTELLQALITGALLELCLCTTSQNRVRTDVLYFSVVFLRLDTNLVVVL